MLTGIPLPSLAILRVTGADAGAFLQGQLTNDTRLLADGRTQLSALNTPQGRVVAIMRLRQGGDGLYALLPADLAEPVAARLRKFVMRARVAVELAGDLQPVSSGETVPGSLLTFDYAPGRAVSAVPTTASAATVNPAAALETADHVNEWTAADIAAGLPQVLPETSGSFVPQMLNLDLLDAISFSKGCYTGQEIVARTQHLGRIKRRSFRYRLPGGAAPAPLAPLFLDGAKVAEVVMSATVGGAVELLAVTSLEARGHALETGDGREARMVEMPYPVPGGEPDPTP
jgi:folate-binding protein YgfZ